MDTLAYPRAALLGFGVAVAVYDLLQVVKARVEQRRTREKLAELSGTLLALVVRAYLAGVGVALRGVAGMPDGSWGREEMRRWLDWLEGRLDLKRYGKSRRGEKKTRKVPRDVRKDHHGATARILLLRKKPPKSP